MRNRKDTPEWAKYKNRKRLIRKERRHHYAPKNIRNEVYRTRLTSPSRLTLLRNREATLSYLEKVFSFTKKGRYVDMDMSGITETDALTVSLIIAIMMDKRTENIIGFVKHTNVAIPASGNKASEIFKKCNFHETVTTGKSNSNYFMSRTDIKVNKNIILEVIKYANNHGIQDAKTILGPILVEIMTNTNNHATNNKAERKEYPWYLSIMENDDKLCFSVIDLGIGIYESLKTNNAIRHLPKSELENIHSIYENKQSYYLSKNIPKGIYSSTKLNYRGKGLKEIYDRANQSKTCKNFTIITNKAKVNLLRIDDIEPDSYNNFRGTAYYWEMKK